MRWFRFAMVALTLMVVVGVRGGDFDGFKELKVLKGSWAAEGKGEGNGLAPKDGKAAQYVSLELIADGTTKINGNVDIAQITLDPSKSPKAIDIEYVEGSLKGKKQYGIYEFKDGKTVEEETWIIVVADIDMKEVERPTDLNTSKGMSKRYVFQHPKQPAIKND